MNIAIITPIYRHTPYLNRMLASVLWQLHPGDSVHLACEREEYQAIENYLASLNVPSVVSLRVREVGEPNCASARNAAIGHTSAEWLKFLDADDLLAPFALASFRAERIPETVHCIAGGQVKVVDEKVCGMGISGWNGIEQWNPTVPSMTFVRASAFHEVDGFDSRIGFEEDWDLWLRLRWKYGMGCFGTVRWPVCYYCINPAERAARTSSHQVEGMDVREYFAKTYGITPLR